MYAVTVELTTGASRVFAGYDTIRITPDRTLLITFPPGSPVQYTEIPVERILLWYKAAAPPPSGSLLPPVPPDPASPA